MPRTKHAGTRGSADPPAIVLRGGKLYQGATRLRDAALCLCTLVVCGPVLLLLALIGRRSTGSTAMFRQERLGKDGKPFILFKLRTLRPEAPTDLHRRQTEHLATPFGSFLRKCKLDELPQLWNVLKGDMALVGPRPIMPQEYQTDEHRKRLAVRPGMTGLWQLSRARDDPFHKFLEYDLFYIANRSFTFDLWLIWRTILLLVFAKQTKIRRAVPMWERNSSWRDQMPHRSRAVPGPKGRPRGRLLPVFAFGVLLVLLLPGMVLALSARSDLLDAQSALTQARDAVAGGEPDLAEPLLEQAGERFGAAQRKLDSWALLPVRAAPGIRNNLEVPRALAEAGEHLVAAGGAGLQVARGLPVGGEASLFAGGAVDLQPLEAAGAGAEGVRSHLLAAWRRFGEAPSRFLLPPVADARRQAAELLGDAVEQAESVVAGVELLPALLGGAGRRTWVLGAENNSELRGRGGYLGSFGVLTAEGGRLELADFQPTSGLDRSFLDPAQMAADPEYARQYLPVGGLGAWQNLLMSPDLATGAPLFLDTLHSATGIAADGLIVLDPVALSYLLEVTGPVEMPDIPEPITGDNVVDWSLNRLYLLYQGENDERKEQLSEIADAVWERVLNDRSLDTVRLVRALGRAASERHLAVYSSRPEEQELIGRLGIGGRVAQQEGDYLLMVGQNVGENKMDYYLSRAITYHAVAGPDGGVVAEARVTVTNTSDPGVPLPGYITGDRTHIDLPTGHARSFVTWFVPERAELQQVLRNGSVSADVQNSTELGKRRLATYVQVGPGETEEIVFRYRVPDAIREGEYRLMVQRQATARPDTLSVSIELPEGMRVARSEGFRRGQELVWDGPLVSDMKFSAQLEAPLTGRVLAWLGDFMSRPVTG